MNAQTAAVIDFQKPLKLEGKSKTITVRFSSYVYDDWRKKAICQDLSIYYAGFIRVRPDCVEARERRAWYKGQFEGLLESLNVLGAITRPEYDRLRALLKEQGYLFEEQQAA